MKRWIAAFAVAALVLAVAPAALAAGIDKTKPGNGPKTLKFNCQGTIVSVDAGTNTFVVKVKNLNCSWRGAKRQRGKDLTFLVTDKTTVLMRQIAASGATSKPVPLAFADLKANRSVRVSGQVVVENGKGQWTAARVVMLVPTYKFQSNATIKTVDAGTNSFIAEIKTMSRNWNGWKQMKALRGQPITFVVTDATKIFTRQLDASGEAASEVAATLVDLAPGGRVHIGGRVIAADDGNFVFRALRIVEFIPAPPAP